MPPKIFISYRREDSGANAIGIGQYLEKEFGSKNVYIDVEMQAGTKYPAVIEKRLSECRVLVVLIGPDWLKCKDEQGRLRLNKSDDWVRLEIARALERNIAIIPVLINGAQLPEKEMLPADIQGLLDHQVAWVSVAGFRHEMVGLVRDIRSIKLPRRSWPKFGSAVTAAFVVLMILIIALTLSFPNLLGRLRGSEDVPPQAQIPQSDLLRVHPGEWVVYAFDQSPAAYFFNTKSVELVGDRISYTVRFALKSNSSSSSEITSVQGVYEDDTTVVDCKGSTFAIAERTVYNGNGDIIFHQKLGIPESLNSPQNQTISPGSIIALGQRIMCDEQLRALFSAKQTFDTKKLSYLANAPNGNGVMLYGAIKPASDTSYNYVTSFVTEFFGDQAITGVFPAQNIRGLPAWNYRIIAQNVSMSCTGRKMSSPAIAYYDKDANLEYLAATISNQPIEANVGSIYDALLNVACGTITNVSGNYEGMNNIKFGKGGEAEQRLAVVIQQNGSDLKVSFQSGTGGRGEGTGTIINNHVESISLHSTVPECPGSYTGSLSFSDGSITWSYTGTDCAGSMEGRGTGKKVER